MTVNILIKFFIKIRINQQIIVFSRFAIVCATG